MRLKWQTKRDDLADEYRYLYGKSHARSLREGCAGSQLLLRAYGSCLPPIRIRQDFEDGCFQPRARRASQSFGRAALAESLAHCRVMGLSHKGDLHALDGQQRWILWPSGTSHVWPHRSQVHLITVHVTITITCTMLNGL